MPRTRQDGTYPHRPSHRGEQSTSKGQKLPEILTNEEERVLVRVFNPRYAAGLRNKALVSAMLYAGLRAAEALSLKVRDVTWSGDEAGKVHLKQGKGKKDRILSLNAPSLELLRLWRDRRYDPTSKLLFTTREGKPLATRWLRQMVTTYAGRASIGKHIHPHTLRHTFATNLYRSSGHNLRVVQLALGHSSIQTTEIYTHIASDEVGEEMRKLRQAA